MNFYRIHEGTSISFRTMEALLLFIKTPFVRQLMRISILSITFCLITMQMLLATTTSGQGMEATKITLELRDETLEAALQKIEKLTSFRFVYRSRQVEQVDKLNLSLDTRTVSETLALMLADSPLTFRQVNNNILIVTNTSLAAEKPMVARTITGKVTDTDGEMLVGVSILLKGTSTGTITDVEGKYSIEVPEDGGTLVFSYVGYANEEVLFTTQTVIDVLMIPDILTLSEIVVTGYGTQERKDISGAVASMKSVEIQNLPMQSFDKVMQGRMAGVQVSSSTGIPGGGVEIRIRGVGSINAGNDPLYIVDGVQVNGGTNASNTIVSSSNALSGLNPNDIEAIDVLKDAAAASIYGAQAANGVVIITTKRGKEGKTEYNFNTYTGFTERLKKLDLMNGPQFVELYREGVENWNSTVKAGTGTNHADYQKNLNAFGEVATAPSYDWQNALYRRGSIQNYELSASGGNSSTKFFLAGSYNKQQGHVIATDFQRATMRINLNHQATKKLSFDNSLNLSTYTQNAVPSGRSTGNPNLAALLMVPVNPIYNEDGTFNEAFKGSLTNNLVQTQALNTNKSTNKQIIGNFALNYEIAKGFKFRSSYSLDYSDIDELQYFSPKSKDGAGSNGSLRRRNAKITNWQTDQTLTYNTVLNELHNINVVAGVNYRSENRDAFDATTTNFPTELFQIVSAGAVVNLPAASYSEWKLASVFGRVNYIYSDKYILTATVRRDGSSRFGKNNQWGVFPAASVAWRISKESFMDGASYVDDLKLRASYGVTGNASIGDFASRNLYGIGGEYNQKRGITPSTLNNDDLTWEQNKTLNFGLDYAVLGGRITGSMDYFIRTSDNLLLNKPLPQVIGYSGIMENVGSVENRGFEFEVNTVNVNTGGFKWNTAFNISFISNEVTALSNGQTQIVYTGGGLATSSYIYKIGEPLGSYFNYRYAGVNVADGRPMWYDAKGNITYLQQVADRQIVGSTIPDYFGGITNTFSYRGFDLSVFFQYQVGNEMLNGNSIYLSRAASTADYNQYVSQLGRWQNPGDVTSIPRSYFGGVVGATPTISGITSSSYAVSDRFIEDASYVRLKQVTLGYNLPAAILQRLHLGKAHIYVQGLNLWTATAYKGIDPELVNAEGDYGVYPQGKNYTIGIQLGF